VSNQKKKTIIALAAAIRKKLAQWLHPIVTVSAISMVPEVSVSLLLSDRDNEQFHTLFSTIKDEL
jgi:hypothetical protein